MNGTKPWWVPTLTNLDIGFWPYWPFIHKPLKLSTLFNVEPLWGIFYSHYNKMCPCMPSDFTRFWMNSLVVMNGNQWRSSEFTGPVNGDWWIAPSFCSSVLFFLFFLCLNFSNFKIQNFLPENWKILDTWIFLCWFNNVLLIFLKKWYNISFNANFQLGSLWF